MTFFERTQFFEKTLNFSFYAFFIDESYTLEGEEYHYEEFYLDNSATSCFSEDAAEDNESFRKLIKNIFSK